MVMPAIKFALLIPSFFDNKYLYLVNYAIILQIIRLFLKLADVEDIRKNMTNEEWILNSNLCVFMMTFLIVILMTHFPKNTLFTKITPIILSLMCCIGLFIGATTVQQFWKFIELGHTSSTIFTMVMFMFSFHD